MTTEGASLSRVATGGVSSIKLSGSARYGTPARAVRGELFHGGRQAEVTVPDKHQHVHSGDTKKTITWPQMKWHLKKYPACKGKFCRHGNWLVGTVYCVTCGRRI